MYLQDDWKSRGEARKSVIHKDGNLYVADCPELGTVSQGKTIEEAIANLKEASELYLEGTCLQPAP